LNFMKKLSMIFFQSEHIIGFLTDDQAGDLFLTAHRVDGDYTSR
jgi:hypothetical protein